jgi:hypothetical protein
MTTIIAVAAISCEKEETIVGMTISGTLEFSKQFSDKFTEIHVYAEYADSSGIYGFNRATLARGAYSNGTFSLVLPAKIDDKFLRLGFSGEDWDTHFAVSDKSVRIGVFDFTATDYDEAIARSIEERNKETGNNGLIGTYLYNTFPLVYIKSDDTSTTEGMFYYADRSSSITGTMTSPDGHTLTYSMNLKRGWNIVYYTDKYLEISGKKIRIEELTTNPVSGLKWYVRGDF